MKKVMVIHAYGRKWDYSLYRIPDRIAESVDKLVERGEWARAYELARDNNTTSGKHTERRNWRSLDTIDLLLEYIDGVTV